MKAVLKRVMCLALVLCLLTAAPIAQAKGLDLPNEIFLTQQGSGTCTLCSAAMMLRSVMYINGNDAWTSVTQESIRTPAWINGVGLRWSFKYTADSCVVNVSHRSVDGISVENLKAVLDEHPEGIVLYCGNMPHAVFLMGYRGDVFYCAETVMNYSEEIIPLAESWMGDGYGSQAEVLRNVTAYWYVSSYQSQDQGNCTCSEDLSGLYRVTNENERMLIRAGHGTEYSVAAYVAAGEEIRVIKASGTGEGDWAHVQYNGITGYALMQHMERIGDLPETRWGTVTGDDLRIRAGAGTSYEVLGFLMRGDRVEILEEKVVGAMTWGRTDAGWISLTYVKLDEPPVTDPPVTEPPVTEPPATEPPVTEPPVTEPPATEPAPSGVMGTVTGDYLRIRTGAGTSYEVLDFLMIGDRVEILEQKTVGAMTWGRTEMGWISLTYVKLDEPVPEEPPVTEPPVTEPPVTEPPVTEPPVTEPPATEPAPSGVMGTVTGDYLRIRAGAGTSHEVLDFLMIGDRVEILEQKTVNGMTWGRTEDGWISLDYVDLDRQESNEPSESWMARVIADCLRIRSGAGLDHEIVGFLYYGAKVEIFEEATVEGMTWGRTEDGWISLDYVD